MKQFTAKVQVKGDRYGDYDTDEIVGEGDSPEEAMSQCLEKVREYVGVEKNLENGVTIPAWVAEKIPPNPPTEQRFLLLTMYDDDDDGARYTPRWRIFAVTISPFEIRQVRTPYGEDCGEPTTENEGYEPGNQILVYSFGDGTLNCEEVQTYLPTNTKELVNGEWVTREMVGTKAEDW